MFLLAVIWRPGAQALASGPDSRGGSEVKGDLRLLLWLPRSRCGFGCCLRHLFAHACKHPVYFCSILNNRKLWQEAHEKPYLVFDVFIVLSFVDGTLMSIYLIKPCAVF